MQCILCNVVFGMCAQLKDFFFKGLNLMVRKGSFQVRLVTKKNEPLREIHDTADDRYYAVSRAGDEYKVRHKVVGVSAGFAVTPQFSPLLCYHCPLMRRDPI